ncbi:hypothetical protein M885DRAFT_522164 [Pelagophyceae sp. CCMP2097]|nr:hypothetical protein M885DRAFT_522164 [Pelagophyceae sp. CCMP2097]
MKQLTSNPSDESSQKGWTLLMMCLLTFPPEAELENYVHIYIRKFAPSNQRSTFTAKAQEAASARKPHKGTSGARHAEDARRGKTSEASCAPGEDLRGELRAGGRPQRRAARQVKRRGCVLPMDPASVDASS